MVNTHKMLAQNFIQNINENKLFMIKDTHFIWGNLKPDGASKYKFKKHYFEESFPMIINMIKTLSSMTVSDIYKYYSINKFNQELGVICHFLCDYFCVPHNQRWEFKSTNAVKEHVLYEKELSKVAKTFIIRREINTHLSSNDIEKFILELKNDYEEEMSYENDLRFAYFVCNSVINLILEEVLLNERIKDHISLVV